MTKLKTVKDMKKEYVEYPQEPINEKDKEELKKERFIGKTIGVTCVSEDELRQLAIKWVKEDTLEMPLTPQTVWLLNRWKKRLNITEKDLK